MRRILLASLVVVAPAWAQSKRYPPEPIDKDEERAAHSALWENATNPHQQAYKALVAEARAAIGDRTPDQLALAVSKLDQAIAMLPGEPSAYELRGDAYMQQRDWKRCTADLQAAAARTPPGDVVTPTAAVAQRRRLGLCLARGGQLAEAERVLADAAATGTGTGEMLMRLGEVRIAMGKLDEAISALTNALEATDVPSQAMTRWLLASAYDRARRPAEAIEAARRAAGIDRSFSSLTSQVVPLLGTGEPEYLLGLAWEANEPARAEYALVYFRKFVRIAPESPWRKRAEDHLRELKTTSFPESAESVPRRGGSAVFDASLVRDGVSRLMPAMRACMARLPGAVLEVMITKTGPRSQAPLPSPRGDRLRIRVPTAPPGGVSVALALDVDGTPRAETDAAARCVEPIASKLVLPAIKEQDGWYKLSFLVVAP